jgi:hypothetical protein
MEKNTMRLAGVALLLLIAAIRPGAAGTPGQHGKEQSRENPRADVSFSRDVRPVLARYCLPCHAEEECNPSAFIADSYEGLMKAAKHGPAVVAGAPDSSHLIAKLGSNPPFGDPMPLRSKKAFPKDTLQLLWRWIKQGAKNN